MQDVETRVHWILRKHLYEHHDIQSRWIHKHRAKYLMVLPPLFHFWLSLSLHNVRTPPFFSFLRNGASSFILFTFFSHFVSHYIVMYYKFAVAAIFFSFNVPVSFSSVAVAFFFSCPFDLLSCTQLLSLMIEIYRSKNLLCRHDFSFALSFIPSLFFLCWSLSLSLCVTSVFSVFFVHQP